ncbi:MAG TPA: biotin--[acetyl-CoA-carboxylase] ligase [Burkholderiales bacterium]|nr:biotin--[acetyl-CoA-carboxylase] ligase [Burkholderiales bacterium]
MDLPGIEVRRVERCGSTNELLLSEARPHVLLVAEEQTAGRGRRGRRWHSARGAGVTFSLSALIRRPARELAGLSLVAGVAAARALRALGVAEAALKWPNDLLVEGAKLGGILVETRGSLAVIGVGINCRRDAALEARLRRPIAALEQFIAVDRERVIERVAQCLVEALATFDAHGLEPLRGEWERLHAHAGKRLRVRLADGRVLTGLARGLDGEGALRLETRAGLRAVRGGRVLSARPA